MKTFIDYLVESTNEKKYEFKIKIAGDLPDHCEDVMETALQQYKVSRFTKGKSSPIQTTLKEFPNVKNSAMTIFEVELDYPTTSSVLAELVSNCTGISRDCVHVKTPLEEANQEIEEENLVTDKKESLLNKDYEKSSVKQDTMVGEKYISNFLKDIAKSRKETAPKQYKGANEALTAKKLHTEKADILPEPGPARSLFNGSKKD